MAARVTEAKIRRAVKVAREIDPIAVIEIAPDGSVRILPYLGDVPKGDDEVDKFFAG